MKIVPERVKGELCVASKFAVNGLSDALRMELRPAGVNVTVVCPYWVVTDFHKKTAPLPANGRRD